MRRAWFEAWVMASFAMVVAACTGGGDDAPPAVVSGDLYGTAAVGTPIAGGDVAVKCAGGAAAVAVTGSDGGWRVTLDGHTLPCVVQVSGGSLPAGEAYTSLALQLGVTNITPLTDLIVANLVGRDPRQWYQALDAAALRRIDGAALEAAQARVRHALALPALSTVDPIRDAFTATIGNIVDDILEALAQALSAAGMSYAQLLQVAAAGNDFASSVQSLSQALVTAYANTATGGGSSSGGGGSTPPASGSGYVIAYGAPQIGIDLRTDVSATFSGSAGLQSYTANPNESLDRGSLHSDAWNDGGPLIIGRWYDGTWSGTYYGRAAPVLTPYAGFHYAVGLPATAMPTTGQASYTLVAQTPMTWGNFSAPMTTIGPFTGSAKADFASGRLGLDLTFTMDGKLCSIVTAGGYGHPHLSQLRISDVTVSGAGAIGECRSGSAAPTRHTVYVRAFFSGEQASRLGLVLRMDPTAGSLWGNAATAWTKDAELAPSSAGTGGTGRLVGRVTISFGSSSSTTNNEALRPLTEAEFCQAVQSSDTSSGIALAMWFSAGTRNVVSCTYDGTHGTVVMDYLLSQTGTTYRYTIEYLYD